MKDRKPKNKKFNEKGQAIAGVILLLLVVLTLGLALISFAIRNYINIHQSYLRIAALDLAEAGIEKAMWELNKIDGDSYTGENNTPLGEGVFSVSVTDGSSGKIIISTGFIPNSTNYKVRRTVKVIIADVSAYYSTAFQYAVQVGELGLEMDANSRIYGNVYSNGNIVGYSNSRIDGDAYAVGTISSPQPTVLGTKNPGAPSQPMPDFDPEIWRAQANMHNDPIIGNYELGSGSHTLGPRKIEGNFTIRSNTILTLTGPIYVTGNFEVESNSSIYLDEIFVSTGTVIIVDGTIRINSNCVIHSTLTDPKGFILLASDSINDNAIELNSNDIGGVYYALRGTAQINSNADIVAITAKGLDLNSNAELVYDTGLASAIFSTGPEGIWRAQSWQIVY